MTSLAPQGVPVVAEESTYRNAQQDAVKIGNPKSVVIQPTQVAGQPKAGPSSQPAKCVPGTSHWESQPEIRKEPPIEVQ